MRLLLFSIGVVFAFFLLIFAIENVGMMTSYHFFAKLNQSGVTSEPILFSGALGLLGGLFFGLSFATGKKEESTSDDDW
jgi:hypothetical protein